VLAAADPAHMRRCCCERVQEQPGPHLAEASAYEVAVPVADPAVLGAHRLALLAVLALRQLKVEEDAAGVAAEAQAQNTEQDHMSGRLASAGSRPTYNRCPTLIMNNSQHLHTT
jgi:hypothetical protein